MIHIIFETHATSEDNETDRASGWYDTKLSKRGIGEAKKLGKRRSLDDFDAVFTSDLERAYQTAILAFGENTRKIFVDWRLRECDYGDLTGSSKTIMNDERFTRIKVPFPNGESFEDTSKRMESFLEDLKNNWQGKRILIIGHRATHYGLETYIDHKDLRQCITESLTWKWQPGWEYKIQ